MYRLFQFTPLREGLRQCAFYLLVYIHISIHAPAGGASYNNQNNTKGAIFQFTPLREGLRLSHGCTCSRTIFQFTPLREGLPDSGGGSYAQSKFQFTPLREGLHTETEILPHLRIISIHAPAGGASWIMANAGIPLAFQFTPLREGLLFRICQHRNSEISIHAPAGGASPYQTGNRRTRRDFNSRPCGRGFWLEEGGNQTDFIFQFTPLREGLRDAITVREGNKNISIHAPAGGASARKGCYFLSTKHFNSRPCGRGFGTAGIQLENPVIFQFTPLREGLLGFQ